MQTNKSRDNAFNRGETKRPSWWTDQHTSSWDRVKEAFRRDWEQTKADLSGQKSGRDINQDVGDTIKQAAGKQPIPPLNKQNLPDDPEEASDRLEHLSKISEKANERMMKAEGEIVDARQKMHKDIADAREDLADARFDAMEKRDPMKANEKIARAEERAADKIDNARQKAGEEVMKEREKIADAQLLQQRALNDWSEVENAMRYGYSVRSQYPGATWDDNLETKLKGEWDSFGYNRTWDDSKYHVRRGWNLAGKH